MGQRILVADDDASIRKFLKEIFTKDGYDVDVCGDGQAALDLLAAQEYSLLVTDLEMPRKSCDPDAGRFMKKRVLPLFRRGCAGPPR